MAKTSTATEVGQEGSLREGLEAAIRERVREIIELVLPRYRRSSREVEQSVLGVYLSGSNTRRIRGALEPLLTGAALSKSAVSRLVLRLEESYRTWQGRDLTEEEIVYLYLDAIYPKVRSGGRVVSLPVLVALGVRENGEKVLLSLMTTGAESADGWQLLLDDLTTRKMGRPRLVISDGNAGLGRRWIGGGPGCRSSAARCTSCATCWRKRRNTRTKRCAKSITAWCTRRLWKSPGKPAKRSC